MTTTNGSELDGSIHALTGAYALDAVTDTERAAFDAHLETCDLCATETAELLATAARLALVTELVPPAELRERVLQAVRTTRQDLPAPSVTDLTAFRSSRRRRIALTACGALVAAAAVATGIVLVQPDGPTPADIRAAADAQTFEADLEGGGDVTLVLSASEDAGLVSFSGLVEPLPDEAYQLWVIGGDGVPVPVADQFEPDGDGTASTIIEGVPDDAAVAVTLEEADEPTEPRAPILTVIPTADA